MGDGQTDDAWFGQTVADPCPERPGPLGVRVGRAGMEKILGCVCSAVLCRAGVDGSRRVEWPVRQVGALSVRAGKERSRGGCWSGMRKGRTV